MICRTVSISLLLRYIPYDFNVFSLSFMFKLTSSHFHSLTPLDIISSVEQPVDLFLTMLVSKIPYDLYVFFTVFHVQTY
jgi:hypothetical protein